MQSDNDKTQAMTVISADTVINHYRIVRKIGGGGMGDLYLAQDTDLHRQAALKFLAHHLCASAECRVRFMREAQAAAILDHPNIVLPYEVGEYQGRPYFAMQFVEGQSLRDLMRSGEVPIRRAIEIAIQVCDGLHAAHKHGIIHRDVKPSNILVDTDDRVRIVDFGLAAVAGSDQLTQSGSRLGTIGYMSPEQVKGEKVDQRSDLFSLGIILYELIAGRNPFAADNEAAVQHHLLEYNPEPLARYKERVPDELQRIVAKLLHKDQTFRYQSAPDVISDLAGLKNAGQLAAPAPTRGRRSRRVISSIVALLLIALVAYGAIKSNFRTNQQSTERRKILAVLPFENLGSVDDEYFADGITDEIITDLACLSGLGVISRTSSAQYKDSEKSLRQIGRELNADYILEGTIRWEKQGVESRVRINPQLIRVADDLHLWAHKFDAVLTHVLEVQSQIAQEVATAMEVTLLQTEHEALSRKGETDPAAYNHYLLGKRYFSIAGYAQNELRLAERMFLKAIKQAPDFAQAYAELGCLYVEEFWVHADPDFESLDSAKKLIDMALYLGPNLPETQQALGWYYYHGLRDYDRALGQFSRVLEMQPGNILAMASKAWVQRRRGEWKESIAGLEQVVQLDPLDPWYNYELGITYHYCRRYRDAVAQCDKVIDLQPSNRWAYLVKSWSLYSESGRTREPRAVLAAGRAYNGRWPELTWLEAYYDLSDREYDSALTLLASRGCVLFPENSDSSDYYSLKGLIYTLKKQPQNAAIYLDSARIELEGKLQTSPDAAGLLASLARVYALSNQPDHAMQTARRLVELDPISKDALNGPKSLRVLAAVSARCGLKDQAIEIIEQLLEMPSDVSVHMLKYDPEFDPLRTDPRFETLLKKYEQEHAT